MDLAFFAPYFAVHTLFPIIAGGIAWSRGGMWWIGFAAGLFLGPIGVLLMYIKSGRLCWHCHSRIHLNARKCHNCAGDVVDRRKGMANRAGFGKRAEDRHMRAPTDVPAAPAQNGS